MQTINFYQKKKKNRKAYKHTHAQRLVLFKETNVFVFVSQKTRRPRFDPFEKKNLDPIEYKVLIYIHICVCERERERERERDRILAYGPFSKKI